MQDADVSVKVILSTSVTRERKDPETFKRVKTTKDDKGKEYEIRATETHYKKNSTGYVNGRIILRDRAGRVIEERKIYGESFWRDHWMTYTGHKDAVKNSEKHLRGSKEEAYPT